MVPLPTACEDQGFTVHWLETNGPRSGVWLEMPMSGVCIRGLFPLLQFVV